MRAADRGADSRPLGRIQIDHRAGTRTPLRRRAAARFALTLRHATAGLALGGAGASITLAAGRARRISFPFSANGTLSAGGALRFRFAPVAAFSQALRILHAFA